MPGILVGIDGSDHSRQALEWAVHEATVRHAPLTVLTVYQPIADYWGGPVVYCGDPELAKEAYDAAEQETHTVLEKTNPASRPPSVTIQAVTGLPAQQLLSAAEGADMIVVGARGAGGFRRLLLGSVAAQVTYHAHCPVVVVPDGKR